MNTIEVFVKKNMSPNDLAIHELMGRWQRQILGMPFHAPIIDRGDLNTWMEHVRANGEQVKENVYILPTENGYSDIVCDNKLLLNCFPTNMSSEIGNDTLAMTLNLTYENSFQ